MVYLGCIVPELAHWGMCFVIVWGCVCSMRIIQPLSRISCGEGNAFGLKAWNVELDDAPGPITSRIYDEVLQKLPVVDIRSVV